MTYTHSFSLNNEEVINKFKREENKSALIQSLLIDHYEFNDIHSNKKELLKQEINQLSEDYTERTNQINEKIKRLMDEDNNKETEIKKSKDKEERIKRDKTDFFFSFGTGVFGIDKILLEGYLEDYLKSGIKTLSC